jgi:predicted RNA-binding protein with PIN domain
MIYLIDGNNLAGKLGFLEAKDCNRRLEDLLIEYFTHTKKSIVVVFDSLDPLGDKYTRDDLQIVYAPRDGHYSSADDKIMELIEENREREITVVSDDIEIREKVEDLKQRGYNDVRSRKVTELISEIEEYRTTQESKQVDDNKGLSDDEIKEINKELKEHWGL